MENKQKFTVLHRLLHWLIAISMLILFFTGFLRMYWMNKGNIVEIIKNKTDAIPTEKMTEIATSIRAPMWEWHELFAHVMIISFVIRIAYMLIKGIKFPNPFKKNVVLKEKLQGFVYIYFYVFVFISAFTGICIEKGFFEKWEDLIETTHKLGIYWFPIFIMFHFGGIVISEIYTKKGLSSKMIGGDKT